MNIIDWILYIPLALCVCYLLLYAIASKFYRAPQYPEARMLRRIAVLFPAPFFPISPVILPSGTSVRFEPGEEKEVKKLDFDQRISASIHNHHH